MHVTVRRRRGRPTSSSRSTSRRACFEAFLRGRSYTEPVDITARICGICPVAYQMSACHAIESIADVHPGGAIRELRRLLYCGEWIESHVLHMAFLHAPDFLGVDSGIEIARQHPELMAEVLHLKKTGNRIMEVVGGRPIHPVNVRLGGFYRAPTGPNSTRSADDLERAHAGALALLRWVATFEFPSIPDRLADDTEYVSLRHGAEYPFNEGRIVSNRRARRRRRRRSASRSASTTSPTRPPCTRCSAATTDDGPPLPDRAAGALDEQRRSGSRLGARRRRRARASRRSRPTRSAASWCAGSRRCGRSRRRSGSSPRTARPAQPALEVPAVAGVGHGCTEAPRGILYHRYEIDANGTITDAVIIPPTSQNQDAIETDLRDFVGLPSRPRRPHARTSLRAGDPQLRPLHLVCDPLPPVLDRPQRLIGLP